MDDDVANVAVKPGGSARVARWAGTLGVVIPAAGFVAYPIWSFPETQTPGSDVALWATAHHDRLVVMMLLYTVGVTLWLPFGAAIWAYLRDRLAAGSTLSAGFAAGFVGFVTLIFSGFTAFDLLLYRHHSADTAMLLYDLTFGLLAMSGMPTTVSLASFAIAVYAHRMLPRSTAHIAVAAVAAHLLFLAVFIVRGGPLSLETFSTIGLIPLFLFAWILATALAIPRETK
jgi:hypothetical protein